MNLTNRQKITAISFVILSLTLTALSAGINTITYPTILINNHVQPYLIGIAASIELIAGIAVSFFLSRMVKKTGIYQALGIFTTIYIAVILTIYFYVNYALWVLLSTLNGICWISFLAIRQGLVNNLVNNKQRSIVTGIAGAVISSGFVFAPLIAAHFGADNYQLFIISATLVVASFLILIPAKKTMPNHISANRIAFGSFFKDNPEAFIGNFLVDLQVVAILVFSVIVGHKIGFSTEKSGIFITAFAISGTFDIFSGFVVKKSINPKKMINIGILLCLLSSIFTMLVHNDYAIMLVGYFFLGASIGLTFVSSSTVINNHYKQEELIAANATFQAIGMVGALIGSILIGIFMQFLDFYGFFIAIILVNFIALIYNQFYAKKTTK
jgi:MFS family permease